MRKLQQRPGRQAVPIQTESIRAQPPVFGGDITVEVTITDGRIASVDILSAEKEDSAYLTMAKDIIPEILDAQSADVDTISGATFSSTGIKNATAQALAKGGAR